MGYQLIAADNVGANTASDHKQVLSAGLEQLPFRPGYLAERTVNRHGLGAALGCLSLMSAGLRESGH
ncbi:hypothetical protein IU487_32570 [Nocardia puris]|uniref:hypothetical protein n=1 Tax=Nocardia puris TaxID=208602 RepID=UPI00189608BD|nr:hypothetical protein [Nocardia puris]MBF6215733.1 hypothetical protein [Nocardia puris]